MSPPARPTTRTTLRPVAPTAPPAPARRPTSSPGTGVDEYVLFCEGVRVLAGLDLLQYKRGQMERRLRSFAQRLGMASLADYLLVLQRDAVELDRFLDRVTINVSQLWRNPEQWVTLGAEIVPVLLADVVDELLVKLLINDSADAPPPEP